MAQWFAPIVERHEFSGQVRLTLLCPDLAQGAQPGHFVLMRCAPSDTDDPLLRRTLFILDADPQQGIVRLLVSPEEPGLRWLSQQSLGTRLDLVGPIGRPFELPSASRQWLLLGSGAGLAALLFSAQRVIAKGGEAMLLVVGFSQVLPDQRLVPAAIEYQTVTEWGELTRLLSTAPSPVTWADQIMAALPISEVSAITQTLRSQRLRWKKGFAQILIPGTFPCGNGSCRACLIDTRDGLRTACKDGPVFDAVQF